MKLDEVPRKYYTPIYKAVYLTQKYKDHESAVDCLLGHILSALGFNEGRLFSFPQMRSPLKYGEEIKFAIADFTFLDVVSFYRSCFCEDKSVKEVLVDSSPQMIAEAFALHQLNSEYPITNTSSSSSEAASDIADPFRAYTSRPDCWYTC